MRKSNLIKVTLVAMPMMFCSAAFAVETEQSTSVVVQSISQTVALADGSVGGIPIPPVA